MENRRVVVVTGVTGGLGPSVAEAFSAAGYDVAGVARTPKTGPYRPFAADLTSPGAVRELASGFDRVDVVAHCAGGFQAAAVAETESAVWDHMFDLNTKAAFHVFREFLPLLRKSPAGRLIAVGSRAGLEPARGIAAYAASKAALHALVLSAAAEVSGTSTTVNAVLPSTIDTPANRTWGSPEQAAKWVSPQSIASAILWLASEGAGDINGALLPIFGGA
jgi:3-oxoacyl-[acyl-carrier protein] reductase